MTDWITYDQFVDRIRNHHHEGFSGLITGVSKSSHSFQIGFVNGNIVLLSYRIFRGQQALEKIAQIKKARITEHHTPDITNITIPQPDLPDINTILSRLTTNLDDNYEPDLSEIIPAQPHRSDLKSAATPATTLQQIPDSSKLPDIKSAANHHFGPIGAMVCDEYLSDSNLSSTELSVLLYKIAEDVGANDKDTQAFLHSVS